MRASRPWLATLRRGAARATKLLQCQPTLGARAPCLGPCIVELPLTALASGRLRRTGEEPVRSCGECTVLPRTSDASDAIPLSGQPPPLFCACAQSNRSAVEPTSQPARSRQRSNPLEASTHASKDALVLSPVWATPTPSSPTRDPRRRATSVICEPIQASAPPKRSLSPGAFHYRRASSRSLPHRPPLLTDESMSETGNAIMTSRSRPLLRGPMTGLPSVPGLDTLGSSALASFFPRDIAASR